MHLFKVVLVAYYLMAPAEDQDSGMESQEGSQQGSQSVDPEVEKESKEDSIEKDPPARKQPAIENGDEEDEVSFINIPIQPPLDDLNAFVLK